MICDKIKTMMMVHFEKLDNDLKIQKNSLFIKERVQAFLSCSKNSHEERRLLGGRWEAAFLLMFISVLFSIIVECVVVFFVTTAPTIGFKPLTAGMSGLLLVQR